MHKLWSLEDVREKGIYDQENLPGHLTSLSLSLWWLEWSIGPNRVSSNNKTDQCSCNSMKIGHTHIYPHILFSQYTRDLLISLTGFWKMSLYVHETIAILDHSQNEKGYWSRDLSKLTHSNNLERGGKKGHRSYERERERESFIGSTNDYSW